jgi:hypothetical protein
MHKLSLIRVQLLLFFLCGVQYSLHGMLNIEKDKETLCDIVVINRLSQHDYHTYRTVAMLSKLHNEIIEDRYKPKKKCIEEYIEKNKDNLLLVTGTKSWNKDFSKCAWVTYGGDAGNLKKLQLTLVEKCDDQVISKCVSREGFYFPIFEDNIRPFFDKDEHVSFYGYGETKNCGGNNRHSFVQYCFDLKGNSLCYECWFYYYSNFSEESSLTGKSLLELFQCPALVKAILQSKKVEITHCCGNGDQVKELYITRAIIPDNYKLFVKSAGVEKIEKLKRWRIGYPTYTSYDSLEGDLKKAIDDQYEQQQAEKIAEI